MGLWKIFDQFAGSGVEDFEVGLDARVFEYGAHRSDPLLEDGIELMQGHPILVLGARDEASKAATRPSPQPYFSGMGPRAEARLHPATTSAITVGVCYNKRQQ